MDATRYARRIPGGKVHHIVPAGTTITRCGEDTAGSGWAVWPVALNRRVDLRPTCVPCLVASSGYQP